MKYSLIYFDDQIQNVEVFKFILRERFDVIGCTDSAEYAALLEHHQPHAILIDLHMPVLSGIELYGKIQDCANYNGCPIFFISGDVSNESRLRSIRAGGIDFFERSLHENEIILRLLNKIQRFQQGRPVIQIGNLRLDSTTYTVTIENRPIDLTLMEMRLLGLILRSVPEQISKNMLLEKLWGDSQRPGKIFVNISNMTLKLWDWDHKIKIRGDTVMVQLKEVDEPEETVVEEEKVPEPQDQ